MWYCSHRKVLLFHLPLFNIMDFPCGSAGKESACNVGDLASIPGLGRCPGGGGELTAALWGQGLRLQCRRPWFDPWVGKILWRRDRVPTPVFLGFPCDSAGKDSDRNVGDLGLIPGLGISSGEGKGYSLQYSGLENSMNCIVHGVAESRTPLSDFHFRKPQPVTSIDPCVAQVVITTSSYWFFISSCCIFSLLTFLKLWF